MNERALKVLEYQKIVDRLVECADSQPGKEKCRQLQPSADLAQIERMQSETADALKRILLKGSLSFSGLRDMRMDIRRLEIGSSMSAGDLLKVAKLLQTAARVKAYEDTDPKKEFQRSEPARLKEGEQAHWTKNRAEKTPEQLQREAELQEMNRRDSLTAMFEAIEPLAPLKKEIERCIIAEDEIADDASAELRRIRRQIASSEERIHTQLQEMVNGSARTYLQDAIITQRDGRYCLPVRSEYRSQVPGMVHDQSSTGSTVFIEPMAVVKLNNDIRALESEEKKEIEKILARLSGEVAGQSEDLVVDIAMMTSLDFIFARASLARKMNAARPDFNESGIVDLKKARHPLLDRKKAIPVDIWIGKDFDQLVISGPNTGGKTVSLKTVGLLELMGQSGLHIPAREHSALALFHEIYADIGDEQSIEQSLSTFSSHMTNIVSFWNEADGRSLVLFDELGAGTDPEEGAALAISILSHLHTRAIRTIATTHYSEVKIYALSTEGVENASCEFDVATLRPTYRLLIGVPGKSNAFAISKKLGLPDAIIEDARGRIAKEQESFEDVISDLENRRIAMERSEAAMSEDQRKIRELRESLERERKKLEDQKSKIIDKAREEAADILKDAKAYADETIRNFNKYGSGANAAREMERQRTALREKMTAMEASRKKEEEKKRPRRQTDVRRIRIGDSVQVLTMNLKGIVRSLPDKNGNMDVQMGILHSVVNVKDVELLDEETVKSPTLSRTSTGKVRMSKSASVSPEINLLGMTVDEATSELDKYLDDAALAHLEQVRVVHGKGTGALRAGVQNYLRKNRHVASYRLGEFGEGDAGVTIVTLK